MHFCVSFISAWWFVWRFCYIMSALLFPTHLMCTRHSISERLITYSWFQPGSVKFILFCKYSCIPLSFPEHLTHQIKLLGELSETRLPHGLVGDFVGHPRDGHLGHVDLDRLLLHEQPKPPQIGKRQHELVAVALQEMSLQRLEVLAGQTFCNKFNESSHEAWKLHHWHICRIFFQGGGGGGVLTLHDVPNLKELMSSDAFFLPFHKIFGSIFQAWSRGTHRTSPTSLTSKKQKQTNKKQQLQSQWGGGGGEVCEPPTPHPPAYAPELHKRAPDNFENEWIN